MEHGGYIYMMTNTANNVLYIGVTSSLSKRITEHANDIGCIFTSKYKCHKLVYFEVFPDIKQAIAREKQLKNWKREWKDQLVNEMNPEWRDLGTDVMLIDAGAGPA